MIIKETIHVDIKNNVFTKTDQITNLEMITRLMIWRVFAGMRVQLSKI